MQVLVVGIDVAKDTLRACFQAKGQDTALGPTREYTNTKAGWQRLQADLDQVRAQLASPAVSIYLEATGVYADKLCRYLASAGLAVHIVPPDRLAYYLRAVNHRRKTDSLDAQGIARFGAHHDWPAWAPQSAEIEQLRHLQQAMESLKDLRQQARNRLHADEHRSFAHPRVVALQKQLLNRYEKQLRDLQKEVTALIRASADLQQQQQLLRSIPGVGPDTVLAVLALVGERLPESCKHLVSYVGLAPRPFESGASVHRRATTAPSQGRAIRKMLYMGVLQAFQCNHDLRAFYDRLRSKGKPAKVALTACMRKQLHIIWGVLKHRTAFDLSRQRGPVPITA